MQRFLFDRLCQPKLNIGSDSEARLTFLRHSIADNLQQLVNHRAFFGGLPFNAGGSNSEPDTVLNFGIGDIVSRSANFEDTNRVKEQIRKQIRRYEPRLLAPEISLIATDMPLMPAIIEVNGIIKADELEVEFSWKPLVF